VDTKMINLLSGTKIIGYYDEDCELVIAWFYSEDKSDMVAYLKPDMSWDMREITGEKSEIFDDREVVVITHAPVGLWDKDSSTARFIKKALDEYVRQSEEEDELVSSLSLMKVILENNSYEAIKQ